MSTPRAPIRIAVLDDYHTALGTSPHLASLTSRPDVEELRVITERLGSPQELAARVGDCAVLVAIRERTRFTAEVFEALPRLRLIAQTGNHAYHIDMEAASRHGVAVAMDRGASGGSFSTAELAIGLMIVLLRNIRRYDALLRAGGWEVPFGRVMRGKTLGLLGLGNVGSAVAKLASAFGMEILAWSRHLTPERAAQHGAQRAELDDLLGRADIVSVHLTLSPESRGLLDARRLGLMKPGALLLNTSRGPVVDEAAMVEALRSGHLGGAGLDVFDQEPMPLDHPLRSLPNVVLTPHVGWPTDAGYETFGRVTAQMVVDHLEGRHSTVVNPDALKGRGA
jgi:phosphoglycerate dehydrogenase-like enzyme